MHLVYAHPSDQSDRIATYGDAIATDVASADLWWRTQDPARTLRYDLFAFPSCSGFGRLDLSDVALPHDSSYYRSLGVTGSDRYNRLLVDLASTFSNGFKKYVVYYDGPVDTRGVCGQGGGDFTTGPSFAFAYIQACNLDSPSGGEMRAHVALHELIHSLGAVGRGAPNQCTSNLGHVCDNTLDIMYWQLSSTTTLDTDLLDYNRNDYYGTDAPTDIRKSAWLVHLDTPQLASSVAIAGTGTGSVRSDLPGIDCPLECLNSWDRGTAFVLSAEPGANTRFVGWGGSCSGTEKCLLSMDSAKNVTATFAQQVSLNLTVDTRTGRGSVVSTPSGLSCPSSCVATFDDGQVVTLSARPTAGSRLIAWGGACKGRGRCVVTAGKAKSVSARFGPTTARR